PGAWAVEAREEREREHRQQILRGDEEMRETVVERAEPGRHEMGVGGARRDHDRRQRDQRAATNARHAPPPTTACQRKTTPASATPAPRARSAARPVGQRCAPRSPIPGAWSRPVAITNPML